MWRGGLVLRPQSLSAPWWAAGSLHAALPCGGSTHADGPCPGDCRNALQHVDCLLRLPCAQVALISGLDGASVTGVLKSKHHDGTHLNNALKVVTIRKEKGKERQGISLPGGSVIPDIDGTGDLSK